LFIYARVNYDDNGFHGNNIWRVDTDYVRSQGRLKITPEMMKDIEKNEGWVPEALLVATQQKMKRHKGVRDRGYGYWLGSMGSAQWKDGKFSESEIAKVLPHESTWPLLRIKDFDAALHSTILRDFWAEFASGEDNSSSHGALLVRETFEGLFLPGLGYDHKTMMAKIEGDALKQHVVVDSQTRIKRSAL
jgi:hypothetical protein